MEKTLNDVHDDSVCLHALLQGAVLLFDETNHGTSPASNALYALLSEVTDKADRLSCELSVINDAQRRGEA